MRSHPTPPAPTGFAPIGTALDWAAGPPAELADVDSPDAFAAAERLWRTHAPPVFAGLLSASDGFTFDADAQRFLRTGEGGRSVPDDAVDVLWLAILAAVGLELEGNAGQMAAGRTPVDQWQLGLSRTLRALYVAAAALGAGGLGRLTDADRLDVAGKPPTDLTAPWGLPRRDVGWPTRWYARAALPPKWRPATSGRIASAVWSSARPNTP
jgi:hypothetical protein